MSLSLLPLPLPLFPLFLQLKHGSAAAPAAGAVQKRFLNVHEYISMDLMKAQGITVPKGHVAFSAEEAEKVAHELLDGKQNADVVVKAQVLAGGRGLGTFTNGFHGGVHVATSVEQAKGFADKMIGQKIVTKQTGEEGRRVDKVFIVERLYLRREMYFSILMDRAYNGPVFIGEREREGERGRGEGGREGEESGGLPSPFLHRVMTTCPSSHTPLPCSLLPRRHLHRGHCSQHS